MVVEGNKESDGKRGKRSKDPLDYFIKFEALSVDLSSHVKQRWPLSVELCLKILYGIKWKLTLATIFYKT